MSTIEARQSRFEVSLASGDVLDVRRFSVHERISALFSVTVTAVSPSPNLDFEAVIGQGARFAAQAGLAGEVRTRVWTGICRGVKEVAVEESGLSTYEIEIVPALWLASQRRNHRMFQLLSDLDVANKILSEWGIECDLRLCASYKKRKYRVQYGESDYAFVCRLLEDSGISFYFTGDSGETRLVLCDAPETNDLRDPRIAFRDRPGDVDLEHVTRVQAERKVRPGRYTLRDHDYRRAPSYRLLASAAAEAGVEQQLERFHYTPGAFLFEGDRGDATPAADDRGRYRTDEAEAATIAQRRLDAQRSEAFSCTFESNAIDLAPGVVFGMRDHPRAELGDDRALLVVESRLHGEVGQRWKVEAEARSAAVRFRPPLSTPKPRVVGVESATVVGPAGEEIHTDEFGRVRVHFHWDRESRMDQNSSCWIHVSQPWGGTGYGGVNLPRIGQEVLVDFLGGDPDRPIIVGRVYTNLQKVPYALPANKTQSGWKSNSTNATGGFNELMFEDAAGQELVRMQAEKDMHKLVKNDEEHTVGRDRTRVVGETERVSVGQNQSITVGINRTTQIGNNDTTIVGVQHLVMISPPGEGPTEGSSSITMTDKKIVMDTGAGATITMDHDRISIVADDLVELWGKKRGVNLHAPAAGGKANVFTGDSFTVDCKKVSITAGDQLKIVGKDVSVIGTNTAHLAGGTEVTIDGGKVEVKGGSKTDISGGVVLINGPGQPAGRVGDAVGGTILSGSSTVLIGGKGTTPAKPGAVAAKATKKPTPEQIAEIQKALDKGDRQHAIDLATKYYGIDQSNVPGGAKYDPLCKDYGQTKYDGTQTIGPAACSSPDVLASTLVHETTHANQAATLRAQNPSATDWPSDADSVNRDEAQAYKSELDSAHNTGLDANQSEYGVAARGYTKHKNGLSPDMQDKLAQGAYP